MFSDKPGDDLVDPAVGFIRYEDWAKARPVHQQFLSLYPGYAEPNVDIIVDGTRRRYRERLHMYVAEARFVISRPPASLELAKLATLPFVERIDPAIKHQLATAAGPAPARTSPRSSITSIRSGNGARAGTIVICMHSTYKLEGRLPVGIAARQQDPGGLAAASPTRSNSTAS